MANIRTMFGSQDYGKIKHPAMKIWSLMGKIGSVSPDENI